MDERYSLDNLRDIVLPEAPLLWPPAPGFWLFFGIVTAAVLILVSQWVRARQANAYRRAGLALLKGAGTVHEVSVILKRVALAGFPRVQVASLYGEDWADFLSQTCGGWDFSPLVEETPDTPADKKARRLAATWIRRHRIPRGTNEAEA